ncbi:MAG TPA: GNAT family protein [Gaiellaceae bacterium]|nr:GNAT family protein [Gaiellaceae bacterium]
MVVRCYEPSDAAAVKEAVDASLDHLRPWMPWAHDEPQPISAKVELLRGFRGQFDLGQDFVYGLFSRDESELVGGSGFHTRVGGDALEIGYWIRASEDGKGLATESTAALTRVGFEVCEVDRLEIQVEPANEKSARIPQKLGYVEEARLRRRLYPTPGGEPRDTIVYTMFRSDYPGTPAASAGLEAFDALGERVL